MSSRSYPIPTDGNLAVIMPSFSARSAVVENRASVPVTVTTDGGSVITVDPGSVRAVNTPPSVVYTVQSVGAGTAGSAASITLSDRSVQAGVSQGVAPGGQGVAHVQVDAPGLAPSAGFIVNAGGFTGPVQFLPANPKRSRLNVMLLPGGASSVYLVMAGPAGNQQWPLLPSLPFVTQLQGAAYWLNQTGVIGTIAYWEEQTA